MAAAVCTSLLSFAMWPITLEMPLSAVAMLIATVVAGLSFWRGCLARLVQTAAGLLWLGIALAMYWVPFHEAGATMQRWQADLDRGTPLALHRCIGAYGLHAALIPIGLISGFPEASWEVVALHLGGGNWQLPSGVVLAEPAARKVIRGWVKQAEGGARQPRSWSYAWKGLYNRPEHSLRAALALNCPMHMAGTPGQDSRGVFVDVAATCLVKWPQRASIPVGRVAGRTIALEEGVFRGLQDAGWIRASNVTWTVRVRPGDRRLNGDEVHRTWLEGAMIRR